MLIIFYNLYLLNILEPSPMNRSHSSHSNSTPQYSQSPHTAYNNMQPSAYNTVNRSIKLKNIKYVLTNYFYLSPIHLQDKLRTLEIILLLDMVPLKHLFMMVCFFIPAHSHQLFKAVQDHLPLDHRYNLQIQMIGDEWLKNGLKLNNEVMEDILHPCLMEDDTHLVAGKKLTIIFCALSSSLPVFLIIKFK